MENKNPALWFKFPLVLRKCDKFKTWIVLKIKRKTNMEKR